MSFWDRLLAALTFGLASSVPVGRDAAARFVQGAVTRGRLRLERLSDVSVMLLLGLLPAGSPHRRNAEEEATRRRLHHRPVAVAQALQAAAPPRLTELVESARAGGPQLRGLVLAALWEPAVPGILEDLSTYLARLYLCDPAQRVFVSIVRGVLAEATRLYLTIPPGTFDYPAWVFGRLRRRLRSADDPLP